MSPYRLFGLKNCDRCRAALNWLSKHQLPVEFVDIREPAPTEETLARWIEKAGLETLVNRASTTWRNLSEAERQNLGSGDGVNVLRQHPTLIKRPVLERDEILLVGFKPDLYANKLP